VTKKAIHVYIVKIGKVLNPENITKSQKSDHIIREKAPELNLCRIGFISEFLKFVGPSDRRADFRQV
jgi:hypothetical protein